MTKLCIKNEFKNRRNEIEDLIMLEDSAHGTLCAIHETIRSTDNLFPCSNHKLIKLCPTPKPPNAQSTRIPISRFKRKPRSCSLCSERPRILCRSHTSNPTYGNTTSIIPNSHCQLERKNTNSEKRRSPYISVAQTISCPEKMCCHGSKSAAQLDQVFAQNLINTDGIVNELKGEIERVKHQLHHISQQKNNGSDHVKSKIPCTINMPPTNQEEFDQNYMIKLKNENKRLKREIETKKKMLERSKNDVTKAKEILFDYEKKVGLLQVQALKSSKAMRLCKDRFCNHLKEKEEKIKTLKESNNTLEKMIKSKEHLLDEREMQSQILNESIDTLKRAFGETSEKCTILSETNQSFIESIDVLKSRLLNSTSEIDTQNETIQALEKKLCGIRCICKKIGSKTMKQKETYELQIKNNEKEQIIMSKQISKLSAKLQDAEQQKTVTDELYCKCQDLEAKIQEYEKFAEKCETLEEDCKQLHDKLLTSETLFQNDKQEMKKLIDELTNVVKDNKVTLLNMNEINKQQEKVIQSQSEALLTKEEQFKLMEKESEDFKIKNINLAQEIQQLKKSLSEPCSREACLCISKELDKIKNALIEEKDTQLIKEKIIQDQSQTILNLQSQVKEKMSELSRAQSDTKYLEQEIGRINEKLITKHQELDMEIDEKENLIEQLRILECQRNQLSEEIYEFEDMLHKVKQNCGDNEKQQAILRNLEEQIAEQKRDWDMQRKSITQEKQKAVCAAKFATQKLLDTVEDFQRQVNAQKKVQSLLTKMLHDKDEQLQIVKSKISNINSITKEVSVVEKRESLMKELFFRNSTGNSIPSELVTNTSMYSSCSSCCKRTAGCCFLGNTNIPGQEHLSATDRKLCLGLCPKMPENIKKALSSNSQQIHKKSSRDLS